MKIYILLAFVSFLFVPQLAIASGEFGREVDVLRCNANNLKQRCDEKCRTAGRGHSTDESRCPVWEGNTLQAEGFCKCAS